MRRRSVLAGLTGLTAMGMAGVTTPAVADGSGDVVARLTASRPKMLVGAAFGSNQDPTSLEDAAGRPLGVHRTFWSLDTMALGLATARADAAAGRQPLQSYKIGSWAGAVAGAVDTQVQQLGDELAAIGTTSWVVLHHEPERDERDMSLFKTAMTRLLPLLKRTNVKAGVIVTGYDQLYAGAPSLTFDALVPTTGAARADFVGVDTYNSFGTVRQGAPRVEFPRQWTDLRNAYYQKVAAWALPNGIPWGVAESAITDVGFAQPQLGARWFRDQMVDASAYGASFWSYFNSSVKSKGTWLLTGAKLEAYVDMLRLS